MRFPLGRSARRPLTAIVLVTAAAILVTTPALAASERADDRALTVTQAAPQSPTGRGTPPDDPGRGMVWSGLSAGQAGCEHEFAVVGVAVPMCSHGPDPADAGIDVRRRPTTTELAGTVTDGTAATAGAVPCYGDGSTGPRIQAVYAHAADVPSRYSDVVDLIAGWAGGVDGIFRDSAAETGGTRHVRWVTDASCRLSVLDVQLSSNGDDNYSAMVNELQSVGLNRRDRHYVVWADAIVYCGIGGFISDDRAGSNNANNGGPAYARVDSGCWGKSNAVEAHELMHTLGGVQYSAPHSSGGGHCVDDYDRMCYADSSQVTVTYGCASAHERLFDCGHDDYFHTAPPSGSYLAGHWNAADSTFLERVDPTTSGTTATTSSTTSTTSSTTSTTAPPPPPSSTSVTESWSGSLGRKNLSRSYTVTTGAGSASLSLRFSQASTLTLTVRASDGTLVSQTQGPSVLGLAPTLAAGSYQVTVTTSGPSAKFTLTVTHPPA